MASAAAGRLAALFWPDARSGGRSPLATNKYSLGFVAVVMLVGLRLSIGWHFYKEGEKKYHEREAFTSAQFLKQATGPLADYFHGLAPEFHQWDKLLAAPVPYQPPGGEQLDARAQWEKERAEEAKKAKEEARLPDVDFPPDAPYRAWATRIADDWRELVNLYIVHARLSDEQKAAAGQAYQQRKLQLLDTLEESAEEIVDYQHELSRLQKLEQHPMAGDVPYQQSRAAQKKRETDAFAAGLVRDVRELEERLRQDLDALLDERQAPPAAVAHSPGTLQTIDRIMPYWHMAVGALLLVGLFSRLAALGGAVFLLMVLATQPPWVAGAAETYYQVIELFGTLVLATIPTGRWGGLDFFVHWLLSRCCRA